jgi:hypothetical protein
VKALLRRFLVPLIAALVTLSVVLVIVLAPSEEDRIRQVLTRITLAVAPRAQPNPIGDYARISDTFKETLAERVEITVPELPTLPSSRAELAQGAMQGGARLGPSDMRLTNIEVKLDESKTSAKVDAVVLIRPKTQGRSPAKRRVHFSLRKDDTWRVYSINVAEAERYED